MSNGPSVNDVLQVAQRALAKVNELEAEVAENEQTIDSLVEDLTALELRVEDVSGDSDYGDLTFDEKVGLIREHAFRRATSSHGSAALDYNDIQWEVFDGEPTAKHCYKLMRHAAGSDEDEWSSIVDGVVGFEFRNPDSGNYQLAVDASRAKRSRAFFPGNKAVSSEGGR